MEAKSTVQRTHTIAFAALLAMVALWLHRPASASAQQALTAPVLTVEAATGSSVTVIWTEVEGATGYELWRWHDGWTQVDGSLEATTYTDTGLASDQRYYYAVAAVNAGGRGPFSDNVPVSLSSSGISAPAAAPVLTVEAASATSVTARWNEVEGATGYELWRWHDGWTQVDGSLEGTTYTDTGLASDQRYYYAVAAVNAGGRGPFSDNVPVSLSSSGISAPATAPVLTVEAASATSVTVIWTEVEGATGYELWRWHDGWTQVDGSLEGTTYTDTGLASDQRYYYAVAAVNAGGRGPFSDNVPVSLSPLMNTDRSALTALYNATDGDNWKNNTNWLSDKPLGEWHGVTMDSNGRVAGLRLFDNRLSGAIPPELGSLTNLTQLVFHTNQLSGAIPVELGSLTNLTQLDFGGNRLSGAIPSELGSLTNLELLSLHTNQLSGAIPSELSSLTNLTRLVLHTNQLSGAIPSELGSLTNLTQLVLHINQLSGAIPPELGSLTNLTRLDFGGNQLSRAIPSELGSLTNLTQLVFHTNQLSGAIPVELGSLTNLTHLDLGGNRLSGAIPSELGSLTNLTRLVLHTNQLSGAIPSELSSLTNLTRLVLHTNQLSGAIPAELGSLTNLTQLDFGGNQLSGAIPPELGSLTNLELLSLHTNQLSGAIPSELGSLTNLELLSLHTNQLSGAIPSELGSLTNLTHLALRGNRLSGCIPPGLQNIENSDLEQLGLPDCLA